MAQGTPATVTWLRTCPHRGSAHILPAISSTTALVVVEDVVEDVVVVEVVVVVLLLLAFVAFSPTRRRAEMVALEVLETLVLFLTTRGGSVVVSWMWSWSAYAGKIITEAARSGDIVHT